MPNISLQPGAEDVSLSDLIAGVDRGIFISGAGSWSIDQQRDNFQFGGQIFWEIRNGKLGPMLRDVAYQARTVPFWNSLDGTWRPIHLRAARSIHLRQGAAHANRTGWAWRRACALQGRHHPQHGAERYLTMMLSPDEVKAIASKIIARSGAEACTVSVSGGDSRNFRFARNEATTNGAVSSVSVSIELSFGKRAGSATVNSLDEGALEAGAAALGGDCAAVPGEPGIHAAARAADLRARGRPLR